MVNNKDTADKSTIKAKKRKKKDIEISDAMFFSIIALVLILGFGGYYVHKFTKSSLDKLNEETILNATVQQVSQVIDNIRMAYTINNDEKEISMQQLIEMEAIPQPMIFGHEVRNLYGGEVVIQPSIPLENSKEQVRSPTFKMSYRGLPHNVCVKMAMMNWGNKVEGLMAIATGAYDGNVDTALEEIDGVKSADQAVEFVDNSGRKRIFQPRNKYQFNVARPQDNFVPSPFKHDNAESGCSCRKNSSNCSFAWRYTVFAVDKPNRGDFDLEQREQNVQEILKIKIKEK